MSQFLDRIREAIGSRYAIAEELCSTGRSEVYLAEDVRERRHVAIEVVRREDARLGKIRRLRPTDNPESPSNNGGPTVLESGETDDLVYVVTSYVQRPEPLTALLHAGNGEAGDQAWEAFLSTFGDLLLRTARHTHRGHDASMDAYAFILEKLRDDEFGRLRRFPGGDSDAFSRWLVVVARRLCSDLRRRKYGRARQSTEEMDCLARRRLVDGIWSDRSPDDLPSPRAPGPEGRMRLEERREALESALQTLEPSDRLLLSLRFEDDLPARRIAEFLDWPTPFHVYRRLNRVLGRLRAALRERGVEGADP